MEGKKQHKRQGAAAVTKAKGGRRDGAFLDAIISAPHRPVATMDQSESVWWRRAETWAGAFAILSGAAAASLWKLGGGTGAAVSFTLLSAAAGRAARFPPHHLTPAPETTSEFR